MRAAIMFTTFSLKGCSLVESPCREIRTQNFGVLGISCYPIELSTILYTDQCLSHFVYAFFLSIYFTNHKRQPE